MTAPPARPQWLPIGDGLAAQSVPFLPFKVGGNLPSLDTCLPFYLYPEHRALPHWSAVNDPTQPHGRDYVVPRRTFTFNWRDQ